MEKGAVVPSKYVRYTCAWRAAYIVHLRREARAEEAGAARRNVPFNHLCIYGGGAYILFLSKRLKTIRNCVRNRGGGGRERERREL